MQCEVERGGRTGWECGKHCKKKQKIESFNDGHIQWLLVGNIVSSNFRGKPWVSFIQFAGHTVFREQTIFESTPWSGSLVMLWKNVDTHWKCTTGTTSEARNLPISSCRLLGRPTGCIAFDTWHGIFPRERAIRAEFSPQGDQGIGQGMRIQDANLLISGIISLCARRGRTGQCSAHLWVYHVYSLYRKSAKKCLPC